MATSPPKRLDDPESPHRPRLTAEQTSFLEDYFSHTPRPTTMQKKQHAEELGLSQEKVNVSSGESRDCEADKLSRIGSRTAGPSRSSRTKLDVS
jgi:Homeodomain